MGIKRYVRLNCDFCKMETEVELNDQGTTPPVSGWANVLLDTREGPEQHLVCGGKCLQKLGEQLSKRIVEGKL